VRSVAKVMWVAQLKEPVISCSQAAPSGVRLISFAPPRVACRYFVRTDELFTRGLEHAAAWWQAQHGRLGATLQLTDEASALARAAASDGVHYSFEKVDHVTCSTIFDSLLVTERALYRGELVSFAVGEAAAEAARERISQLVAEDDAASRPAAHAPAGSSSTQPSSREGHTMEVQCCDPDACPGVCGECDWEVCVVTADHGNTCDVRCMAEGECLEGIALRFLRWPKKGRRRRT
jgi:hypothetical protein